MKDIVKLNKLHKDGNLYISDNAEIGKDRSTPTNVESKIYESIINSKDLTCTSYELKSKIDDIEKEYHLSPLRTNLVRSFNYESVDRILEIQCGAGAITKYYAEKEFHIDAIENNINLAVSAAKRCELHNNARIIAGDLNSIALGNTKYDLVLCVGLFGYVAKYLGIENAEQAVRKILDILSTVLSEHGIILIALQNRTGYKYVAGAHEDFTGRRYEGVHDYQHTIGTKTYTKKEWIDLISQSKMVNHEFIYPFPDYKYPTFILSESYLRSGKYIYNHLEGIDSRDYHSIFNPQIGEKLFWESACANGTLDKFANSFCILLGNCKQSLERFSNFDFIHLPGYNRKLVYSAQVVKPRGDEVVNRIYIMPAEHRGEKDYLHELTPEETYFEGPLLSVEWSRELLYCKYEFSRFEACIREYYTFLKSRLLDQTEDLNIDLIPSNIVVRRSDWRVIDKEWKSKYKISIDLLMYRALAMFTEKYRPFLEDLCELKRIYSKWDFIRWGMNLVGLPTDYEHLVELERQDSSFQKVVADKYEPVDLFAPLVTRLYDERPIVSVFWKREDQQYEMSRLISARASIADELQIIKLDFPSDVRMLNYVRIDPCGSFRKEKASFFRVSAIKVYGKTETGCKSKLWSIEGEYSVATAVNLVGMRYERTDFGSGFTIIDYDAWLECYVIPLRRLEKGEIFSIEIDLRYPRTFEYLLARDRYLVAEEIICDERENMRASLAKLSSVQKQLEDLKGSKVWRNAEKARRILYQNLHPLLRWKKNWNMGSRIIDLPKTNEIKNLEPRQKTDIDKADLYARWLENRPVSYWTDVNSLNTDPLISIVMPVYRISQDLLSKTIESVESQSYGNWEFCIVEDGSEDRDVRNVLEKLHDTRIKVIFNDKNVGISAASNLAAEAASGEYITFLDHDDTLASNALAEVVSVIEEHQPDLIYTDEDFIDPHGNLVNPHFKPSFSPDLLFSHNYITHLVVVRKNLFEEVGGFRVGYEGAQDYDLMLRLTEKTQKISHIEKPVYHWRMSEQSTAMNPDIKPEAFERTKQAVKDALVRRGEKAVVVEGKLLHFVRVKREICNNPLVSIVIPFKDKPKLLEKAISAVIDKSSYSNFEIIGVSNDSTMATTYALFDRLRKLDKRIRFVEYNSVFNYSKIVNYGVAKANGGHIVLFNNDIEVINPDWIEALLEHSQRPEVGVVGGKLYFPNNTIQHAGVAIGLGGVAGHMHLNYPGYHEGYYNRLQVIQNVSAVTGALMMFKKDLYKEIGGMDEEYFAVAYNDIDFCLKALKKGYLNIFTPYCEAYHYESKTRGYEITPEKRKRFEMEKTSFTDRYKEEILKGDAYYNSNLNQGYDDFRYW